MDDAVWMMAAVRLTGRSAQGRAFALRFAIVLLAVLGPAAGVFGPPVAAQDPESGTAEAGTDGREIFGRARVGSGTYRPTGCRYNSVQPTDLVTIDGVDHHAHGRRCPGRTADVVFVPLEPPTVAELLPAAVDEVRRRLPDPEPVLQPVRPQGWVVVAVPIDIRVPPTIVAPVVATAAVDGPTPTWVTVTAIPAAVRFRPGEPGAAAVVCRPGWAVAPYRPETPGRCAHTYRNASSIMPGDAFEARLSIEWGVGFESSDGAGSLPAEPTETTFEVEVAEIQTVVTCVLDCGPTG